MTEDVWDAAEALRMVDSQVVVAHAFNSSTWEAEAVGSL